MPDSVARARGAWREAVFPPPRPGRSGVRRSTTRRRAMSKAGSMLRFGAANARSRKAKVNAKMAVRDSAKAAAHAAAGLAMTVRDEAGELTDLATGLTERASESARRTGEQAMLRVGEWVMTPPVAEKLGIKAKRRRTGLLGFALGAAAGVVAGMVLARRQAMRSGAGGSSPDMDAAWSDPESRAPPLGRGQVYLEETQAQAD